jgi:hypothetical protein
MTQSTNTSIHACHFESKEEFNLFLNIGALPSVLLGEHDETPCEFMVLKLINEGGSIGIVGIASYGIGIHPQYFYQNGKLIVGYNKRIAFIEMTPLRLFAEIELLTLFHRFIFSPFY